MTEDFKKELLNIARGKAPINYRAINEAAEGIANYLCHGQEKDEATEEAWNTLTEQEQKELEKATDIDWWINITVEEYDELFGEVKEKAAEMIKNHQQNKQSDFIKNHFIIC